MDPMWELSLSIKAIQRELDRQQTDALRAVGVTAAQADVLIVLGQAGPLSLRALGALLVAEGGHPSRLVDRLVAAGLVAREPAADDRRRVVLALTRRGRGALARVLAVHGALLAAGHRAAGDERDLEATLRLLRRLVALTPYGAVVQRRVELDDATST